LDNARGKNRGTTFLIQGAPDAGKSALLDKLCDEAPEWAVASIGSQELSNPAELVKSMDRAHVLDRTVAASVGVKFFELGGVRRVAGHASPKQILKQLAPESGLILILDEAQKLRSILPDDRAVAMDTLDAIHNGEIGKPVVLLTAGLGITESVYKTLEVSGLRVAALTILII